MRFIITSTKETHKLLHARNAGKKYTSHIKPEGANVYQRLYLLFFTYEFQPMPMLCELDNWCI